MKDNRKQNSSNHVEGSQTPLGFIPQTTTHVPPPLPQAQERHRKHIYAQNPKCKHPRKDPLKSVPYGPNSRLGSDKVVGKKPISPPQDPSAQPYHPKGSTLKDDGPLSSKSPNLQYVPTLTIQKSTHTLPTSNEINDNTTMMETTPKHDPSPQQ